MFFPFKDDNAVLTKFKPSWSEGIVLTGIMPSSLLCVLSPPFSAESPLGIRLKFIWVIDITYEPGFFAMWLASQFFTICGQLSWLRTNWASSFLVLVAVLGCGSFTPSYVTGTCISCTAPAQEPVDVFFKEWMYEVCYTSQLIYVLHSLFAFLCAALGLFSFIPLDQWYQEDFLRQVA